MADEVISFRLGAIEKAVSSMSESMKQLVVLEQKHLETREALSRAFHVMDEQEKRINHIELELPTMKLTRGWVLACVSGTFGMMAIICVKFVFGVKF